MYKIKTVLMKNGTVPVLIAIIAVITSVVCIVVFPQSVEYTVKENITSDKEIHSDDVQQHTENVKKEYTVKYVDGKVCVIVNGEEFYEVKVNVSNLTEADKIRLNEGITVDSENELVYLTQYLES